MTPSRKLATDVVATYYQYKEQPAVFNAPAVKKFHGNQRAILTRRFPGTCGQPAPPCQQEKTSARASKVGADLRCLRAWRDGSRRSAPMFSTRDQRTYSRGSAKALLAGRCGRGARRFRLKVRKPPLQPQAPAAGTQGVLAARPAPVASRSP